MSVMNVLVGLNSVILIFLVVKVFKPFIGSYAAKKGENLATKEDIAQLTKIVEGIKAKISDEVWDRQKQWELKRDAVIGVMRDANSLRRAMKEIETYFARQHPDLRDAGARFGECETQFCSSLLIARVFAGAELIESLQKSHEIIRREFHAYISGNLASLHGFNPENALTEETNAAIRAARKELGMKGGDDLS
jgi:hypothetical protein